MSLPSLPHVSPYDVPICVAVKATMPRIMGPLCVCTPLWQTVFKLTFNSFEIKNAGAHGILDLPCATKLRSWMGYQGWSPWCTCRLQLLTFCSCWIAVPCFPRILRTIRRGEEHPCQHWHLTQTFSVSLFHSWDLLYIFTLHLQRKDWMSLHIGPHADTIKYMYSNWLITLLWTIKLWKTY